MKIQEVDATIERKLITYAITSTRFLQDLEPLLKIEYLDTPYAQIVLRWVLEYYKEYHQAPGKHIQELYQKNASQIYGEENAELVRVFLSSLSEEYKEEKEDNVNLEFVSKAATEYLKLQSIKRLKEGIEECLARKDVIKAEHLVVTYRRIETQRDKGVSVFDDAAAITTAFLEDEDVLFQFPGALGEQVGTFVRGDLVAYMAAAKRGKSWWEWYTAQMAVYHGFRVVFFNLEMTMRQVLRRAWTSFVVQPRRKKEMQDRRTIPVPKFVRNSEEGRWKVEVEEKEFRTVELTNVAKKQKAFRRQFRSGGVKIFTFPAYSATLDDIEMSLDNLAYYDGFIPDVIVVDYADLIVPSKNYRGEYRQQLDEIWKRLRRMAQERNALVVTASQASRAAFSNDAEAKDIAEDIRKVAHVSKLISLNQTKEERDIGVVRVHQLIERDDRLGSVPVVVLQCLDIGQVCLDSKLQFEVDLSVGKK